MNKIIFFILSTLFLLQSISQASSLSVNVNVPEKYTDVESGERLYFEIGVKYPENPQRKDLRLEYKILDKNGNLIAQSKSLKAIETQASFIEFIVIPESTEKGIHFISVKILDYEELSEEVSSSFYVIKKGSDTLKFYFLTLLLAIMMIGFFIILTIRGLKKR
jgi:hypothetical protein